MLPLTKTTTLTDEISTAATPSAETKTSTDSSASSKTTEQKSLVPSDRLRCALSETGFVQHTVAQFLTLPERITFFQGLAKSIKPTKTVKDKLDNWKAMLEQLRIVANKDFFIIYSPLGAFSLAKSRSEKQPSFTPLSVSSPVAEVVDGISHLLIRTANDKVFLLSTTEISRFEIKESAREPKEVSRLSGRKITQLATGTEHTLMLTAEGNVIGLGRNVDGVLGLGCTGATASHFVFLPVNNAKKIFAGYAHSFIITTDDQVLAFGKNDGGTLGLGNESDSYFPETVSTLSGIGIQKIATGGRFNLALDANGNVFAFGSSLNGALGLGEDKSLCATPEIIPGIKAKDIATSIGHCLILTTNGKVLAFGYNGDGALGLSLRCRKSVDTPTEVNIPGDVQKIFAGASCSLFVSRHEGQLKLYGAGKNPTIGLDSYSVVFIKDLPAELFERPAPASQQESACDSAEDEGVEEVILQESHSSLTLS